MSRFTSICLTGPDGPSVFFRADGTIGTVIVDLGSRVALHLYHVTEPDRTTATLLLDTEIGTVVLQSRPVIQLSRPNGNDPSVPVRAEGDPTAMGPPTKVAVEGTGEEAGP